MKTKDQIQEEALQVLLPVQRGGAGITMGGGKTLLGLKHMSANYTDYARFLVVAPKLSILQEWKSQAAIHKLSHLVEHIEMTTYLSLGKKDPTDYDVVYLDECHSLTFKHKDWLSKFKGKVVGLTGTPPVMKGSEKYKMVEEFCPILYKYETDDAVEDNLLNDYHIIIHLLKMDTEKTMKVEKGGKTWYTSEQKTYEYWTDRVDNAVSMKQKQIASIMRMKAMMDFPSKEKLAKRILETSDVKTLLFANTQKQAGSFGVPSYFSKNKDSKVNLEKFKSGEFSKMACVLQLNEGVNIPDLKEVIIMHAYGNERKTAQRLGRALRLMPHEKSVVHILCYKGTVDEKWVLTALEGKDRKKVTIINHEHGKPELFR